MTLESPSLAAIQEPARLIALARQALADDPDAVARLDAIAGRLREPLRVALAGRVKTGKSTLLNALIGEEIAPTDTGECTRVVTWYRYGPTPSVVLVPHESPPIQRAVRLVDHRLDLDLAGMSPADLARIEVTWPAPLLTTMTLIDTPGLASLSTEVSARSERALLPDEGVAEVDAILYLMRHLHSEDTEFLTEYVDRHGLWHTPATTIILLARADEVGGGRLDTMIAAERVAARYRSVRSVRRLCLGVVPVAGLLAQGATTLRQDEFETLRHLAFLDPDVRDGLFRSADHFVSEPVGPGPASPSEVRSVLLRRLGVFGVRLATSLIRGGVDAATPLADALLRHSNVHEITTTATTQLAARSGALRARSALLALDRLLGEHPTPVTATLRRETATALRGDTVADELSALVSLRDAPPSTFTADQIAEAERILGGDGTEAWRRLGSTRGATEEELDRLAVRTVGTWRDAHTDPGHSAAAAEVAATVIRSLEALLASLRRPCEADGLPAR